MFDDLNASHQVTASTAPSLQNSAENKTYIASIWADAVFNISRASQTAGALEMSDNNQEWTASPNMQTEEHAFHWFCAMLD